MKMINIFRSRFVIFVLQFLMLTILISFMSYDTNIYFDIGISHERALIIQFLANYVLFSNLSSLLFIYIIWLSVSLIPILVYIDFKKAYSMNLLTFFFLNFFPYVFLKQYSPLYFDIYFQFHISNTILLGIVIVGFTIALSLIFKKIKVGKLSSRIVNVETIAKRISSVCLQCGTVFESRPKVCFNCNANLTNKMENSSG